MPSLMYGLSRPAEGFAGDPMMGFVFGYMERTIRTAWRPQPEEAEYGVLTVILCDRGGRAPWFVRETHLKPSRHMGECEQVLSECERERNGPPGLLVDIPHGPIDRIYYD